VTYYYYNTATPTYGVTTPVTTQTVTLSGGVVPNSSTVGPLMAGSFSFIGVYSGDSNYTGYVGAVEPFTVNKASSSVSTAVDNASTNQPISGAIPLGSSVYDTATVSGTPFTPTGTVTYYYYNTATPTYGVTTPATTQTVTLSGGVVPNSSTVGPLMAGSFSFIGVYSGDSNYTGYVGAVEPLTVNQASSSVSTAVDNAATNQPISGAIPLGSSVYDTATVSGSPFTPTGTVTYYYYNTATPTYGVTTPVTTQTVTLSGGVVPNSSTVGPLMAGSFSFIGVYSGDSNYTGSVGAVEPFTVNKASSSVSTAVDNAATNQPISGAIPLGSSVYDTATVSGTPFTPTGTVTYYYYNTATPTYGVTTPVTTQTVTLSGGVVPNSSTVGPLMAGSFSFIGVYSGDSNYNGSVGAVEPFTVNKASSSVSTAIYNAATNQPISGSQLAGTSVYDTATVSGSPFTPTGTVTYYFYNTSTPTYGTTTPASTQTVTLSGGVVPNSSATGALSAGSYAYIGVYSGDSNYTGFVGAVEPMTVIPGTPQLTITKTPDKGSVTAGTTVGFTITISNPGTAAATSLMLADPLPTGGNEFFNWTRDLSNSGLGAGTTPADFAITGSPGSQSLTFATGFNSLPAGKTISVHITTPTTVGDVSGGAVGLQSGPSSATYLGAAGNYGVLYMVGSGTHNLSITNVTLGANVGVGSSVGGNGIGDVTFSGPGIVTGRLDFAPGQTNVFNNQNSSNYGPASVNTNVSAVASAISTVTSLNSSLGALSGTNLAINGTQTINESAGTFHTVNGVTYSVFTVTSYSSGDGKVFTINGDGSGDPVVLNFGPSTGNINLGGDVALTGNGLNDDKVIWNFTSSNQNLQLNNNASSFYTMAFHGIILAPNDGIHLVNANLSGRIFGGDNQDMQLVSGLTLHAPILNTATVTAGNLTASASATITITGSFKPTAHFNADVSNQGLAYTPAQIRTAYGINNLSLDGTGQTIAIVDAYDNPAIIQALDTFDAQFGLTGSGPSLFDQYGPAASFLTVLGQDGQPMDLPTTDPAGAGNANWEMETALDVEWAHAIAPGAQIVLVEANSQSLSDLMASVATAASQPGVSVVSMSWGFQEGQAVLGADEATYDSTLTMPGVTFVASTGDYGTADPEYPAFSPNVVAVGGTSLTVNADNSYNSETGWGYFSDGMGAFIGSGGGISQFESEPAYQLGVQSTGYRTTPDVSFVADPATGAWVADPYNLDPSNPFEIVGGTSLSAPSWAGLIALVNQGRVQSGAAALNSSSPTEAQQDLYGLSQSDYNVIASGTNGGFNAAPGYNLVTGLGSPVGNLLVSDLVAGNFPASGQVPAASSDTLTPNPGSDGTNSGTMNAMNVFAALMGTTHGVAHRSELSPTTSQHLTVTNLNASDLAIANPRSEKLSAVPATTHQSQLSGPVSENTRLVVAAAVSSSEAFTVRVDTQSVVPSTIRTTESAGQPRVLTQQPESASATDAQEVHDAAVQAVLQGWQAGQDIAPWLDDSQDVMLPSIQITNPNEALLEGGQQDLSAADVQQGWLLVGAALISMAAVGSDVNARKRATDLSFLKGY
jgi:hypothetical protein